MAWRPRNATRPPATTFGPEFSNIYQHSSADSTQRTGPRQLQIVSQGGKINRQIEGNLAHSSSFGIGKKIMRREGRQHGHVRTHYMPTADSQVQGPKPKKSSRRIDSPAAAGRFHRVDAAKPTNHSKFTGKCGRARCRLCHLHPVGKSSTKSKGHLKHRAQDVLTNHRIYAWRVVGTQPPWALGRDAFTCFGESATDLISFLAGDSQQEEEYYCNSFHGDRQSDDYCNSSVLDVEVLELSRDFQGKAEISEPSVALEVGGTAIESAGLLNSNSFPASDCGSWEVEVLSQDDDDDDWCVVDERGREGN